MQHTAITDLYTYVQILFTDIINLTNASSLRRETFSEYCDLSYVCASLRMSDV